MGQPSSGGPSGPTPSGAAYSSYQTYHASSPDALAAPPADLPAYSAYPAQGNTAGYPSTALAAQTNQSNPTPQRPRRRSRRSIVLGVGALVVVLLLLASVVVYTFTGTTAFFIGPLVIGPQETISGVIQGQNLTQRMQGYNTLSPVAATITCVTPNRTVKAKTNASGAYSLTIPADKSYTCAITAPNYLPVKVSLAGKGHTTLTLNLGGSHASAACGASATVVCAAMTLVPATVHGTVMDTVLGSGAANVPVYCWNDDAALANSTQLATTYKTTTDANGAYTLNGLPPDSYACAADNAGILHRFTANPGQQITQNMNICTVNCPGVQYHNGPVMHTQTVYLDFWLPAGQTYEAGVGDDSHFESLIEQYFRDIGGTSFHGLLTQYWDDNGPIRNSVKLGGVYFDTTPYPHAGTNSDPLHDSDVRASIHRALNATHWRNDGKTTEVFVFTGFNIQECYQGACSFLNNNPESFCAYHDSTDYKNVADNIIYAYAPDVPLCYATSLISAFQSGAFPYNDITADSVINAISHEEFESESDPVPALTGNPPDLKGTGGWIQSSTGMEIGDLCESNFSPFDSTGATEKLAHGHSYLLQQEWSNVKNACADK
ncbi:MAG TPA: carboxypeptidase-like regulatory domain-containing protein [Ktedonobacterales bacterium]|nr:carboxypeptidase-like regulatory domain-containing protein [Ktedonobacterales bacterium]